MAIAAPVASTLQRPLRGLALPLTRVGGGLLRPKDRYDICWGDLLLAIFTPIGGRPMHRGDGSSVPQAVFDPKSPLLQQRLPRYVTDAASRQCPHVRVLDVTVQLAGSGNQRAVVLSISFTPADEPNGQSSRLVRLDRTAVLRALGALAA